MGGPTTYDRVVMDATDPRLRAALLRSEAEGFAARTTRSAAALADAGALLRGVPMSWMRSLYRHPPIVVSEGSGPRFRDVDGNDYLDFNLADLSMPAGFGRPEVARAAMDRLTRGSQFLLPTEDAAWVGAELARRFGMPSWQFTLSATQANQEAIRIARALTDRSIVLTFDGKYHGHGDELLTRLDGGTVGPDGAGLSAAAVSEQRIVAFNDADGLDAALRDRAVAGVLAEPAMTNIGVIAPAAGFHAALRETTSRHGTLLVLDETHTLVSGPGGLTRAWGLEPDILTIGKSIGGGVAIGAYGLAAGVAERLVAHDDAPTGEVATGGTQFASALAMAAARTTLSQVLVPEVYERSNALGTVLADGIEAAAKAAGLDWRAHRLYNRSGYTHAPQLPQDAQAARATFDVELFNLQRLFMANRGIWEAIDSAGPTIGFAMTRSHVDEYLGVLGAFLAAVTSC